MRGHGNDSGGTAGPTDHATSDLNGAVAPLQFVVLYAGKDEKSLSGGAGGKAPCGFPFLIPRGVSRPRPR
jgi:hypothetical protein